MKRFVPSLARRLPLPLLLALTLTAVLLVAPQGVPTRASTPAPEPTPAPAAVAAVDLDPCQWGYYAGGSGPFVVLRSDAEALLPSRLRVGALYRNSGSAAARGALDFDGNGLGDVFRFNLRPDGLYQWQYAPNGGSGWANLGYASTRWDALYFGDFNGDGKTDLFTYSYAVPTSYWYIAYGGVGNYILVNSSTDTPNYVQVGDFNGDGKADIFSAVETAFGSRKYQWRFSSQATGAYVNLATSTVDPFALRMGDFDGDGKTDVFAAVDQGDGTYQWKFSSGGALTYQPLARTQRSVTELNFGDLDGDGKTDVFAVTALPDGRAEWAYWPGGLGPKVVLQTGPGTMPLMGDFDGDGKADAFLRNCTDDPRFTRLPLSTLDALGTVAEYEPTVAEVDGDGQPDLLMHALVCLDDRCNTFRVDAAVAFGDKRGGFTSTMAETLDPGHAWTNYRRFVGEANGDGHADLLFSNASDFNNGKEASLYTAVWNGSDFTLSDRISLGIGLDEFFPWVGDFNGDGRTDFVFNTVCLKAGGASYSCTPGSDNKVQIALNNDGAYTLGPLQVIGTGWKNYNGYVGDVNGDGYDDLIWNSTCQDDNGLPDDCDAGTANYVYVGISNGSGSIALSALQTYGTSGWGVWQTLLGDFNGDGRTDLGWYLACPGREHCDVSEAQVRVALAGADGTFQLGLVQKLDPSNWTYGTLRSADVDGDGRDDFVWMREQSTGPAFDRQIRVLHSNGNGTFTLLPTETLGGSLPRAYGAASYITVGDLTADGRADLIYSRQNDFDVVLNGPVPSVPTEKPTPTPTKPPGGSPTPEPDKVYLPAIQS